MLNAKKKKKKREAGGEGMAQDSEDQLSVDINFFHRNQEIMRIQLEQELKLTPRLYFNLLCAWISKAVIQKPRNVFMNFYYLSTKLRI